MLCDVAHNVPTATNAEVLHGAVQIIAGKGGIERRVSTLPACAPPLRPGPRRRWYLADAWIRDPTVIDYCHQKLHHDAEASSTIVSSILVGIYVAGAVLLVLAGYALLWCRLQRARRGKEPTYAGSVPAGPPVSGGTWGRWRWTRLAGWCGGVRGDAEGPPEPTPPVGSGDVQQG